MALGERDRLILEVERGWWLEGQTKTEVVRSRLRLSLTRYNQLLSILVETKEAEDYDPLLVRRIRKAKQQRRRATMGPRPAQRRRDK